MDRKKIGFRENGGESSSLMAYKPEQCSKHLNHSFSASFFAFSSVWELFPSFIHILSTTLSLTFTHNLLVSPLTGEIGQNRITLAESDSASDQLIEPSEYLSSLYLQQLLNSRPSPSIYPLISEEITFQRKAPTRDHRNDGKLPHKISSHAFLYELLFTEGRFDIRCALISWWAQRVRVSEAQN